MRAYNALRSDRGITLVEVLVAAAIMTMVAAGISKLLLGVSRETRRLQALTDQYEAARTVANSFRRDAQAALDCKEYPGSTPSMRLSTHPNNVPNPDSWDDYVAYSWDGPSELHRIEKAGGLVTDVVAARNIEKPNSGDLVCNRPSSGSPEAGSVEVPIIRKETDPDQNGPITIQVKVALRGNK